MAFRGRQHRGGSISTWIGLGAGEAAAGGQAGSCRSHLLGWEGLGVIWWLLLWGSGRGAEVVRGSSARSPCTLRSLLPS